MPSDDDFVRSAAPVGEVANDVPDFASLPDELPTPPPDASWDPPRPTTKRRRPKRRQVASDLPPLPAGELPADGESRFDWRQRAVSQMRKAKEGDCWYPGERRSRTQPPMTKLEAGDAFHDEVQRYENHFIPLLNAEFAEERRFFNVRLREWSPNRLAKEGFMLEELVANKTRFQPSRTGDSVVYEFKRHGKDAVRGLPHHKFALGNTVLISRTDPLFDPVLADGTTHVLSTNETDAKPISATVYSVTKAYIKIQTERPIHDIASGRWRIDVGVNDLVHRRQIQAIKSLHLDSVQQDVVGVHARRLADERRNSRSEAQRLHDEALNAVFGTENRNQIEEDALRGTNLRDHLLRAFQEDFVPYESAAGQPATSAHPVLDADGTAVVSDGIVPAQADLKAWEVDTSPDKVSGQGMSGATGVLARNDLIQNWAARHRMLEGSVPAVEGDPKIKLNSSQMRAIAMMLSERLSLVQGPPGTGKTRVIVETIKLLKQHWQIPHPILVTAHTHVAVDNLVSGLRDHGVKPLRIGTVERVRPDLGDSTFDELIREHPLHPQIERLEAEVDAAFKSKAEGGTGNKQGAMALKGKLHNLRSVMYADVLKSCDVVCATLLASASRYILQHIDFPMVFLDEASMATEPLSLVPLMKGSCHVAIIGDHKQLPPVIISEAAKAGGLATSLFERLIHERHVPSIMLDTQYRMHPAISAFPSQTFYNSDLKDGTVQPNGQVVPGFDPPVCRYLEDASGTTRNVMFVDHDHPETLQQKSIANFGDAEIVTDVIVDLLANNPDLRGSDIGVIAPYAAQIRTLDQYINSDPTRLAAIGDVLGDRAVEIADIEIKTVDGFEGREKQVIIFSTTRSNDTGHIGFLADWRRLNVGVTRAKRALIMVGNADTLGDAKIGSMSEDSLPSGGTQVWKDFIRHLRRDGCILSLR